MLSRPCIQIIPIHKLIQNSNQQIKGSGNDLKHRILNRNVQNARNLTSGYIIYGGVVLTSIIIELVYVDEFKADMRRRDMGLFIIQYMWLCVHIWVHDHPQDELSIHN